MKRVLFLALIAAIVLAAWHFGLGNILTLETLKAKQDGFRQAYAAQPFVTLAIFFAVYVGVTALSLPGAAVLTLAAGALFGFVTGVLVVSFASSIGATCAFLAARYVLRDWVQGKFGERLKAVNEGIAKDGGFYLFTLRLVPVFPFFLVNLLMGLTTIPVRTFYGVSQIGMLAGTAVYVNAGTQLAHIASLKDIASPGLLGSFIALGIFPWIARFILGKIKSQRVYARWTKPKTFDCNVIVIGGGAAGLVSSYIAAAVKAKVTLVEAHKMGGDCLNYGCVPSKALIRSAKLVQTMKDAAHYGLGDNISVPPINFKAVMARVHEVIRAVEPHDSIERYTGLGVDVEQGYGTIIDPWTVSIRRANGETITRTARSIVIAAGAQPFVPPLPGIEESGYVTSDTVWERFAALEAPPQRLVVLGGGPIGCELAQSFARLGCAVTQVEMAPRIMIREDEEVSALVQKSLEESGVRVLTQHRALRCVGEEGARSLIVEAQGQEQAIPFDALLVAVGRSARLSGYGLEELGIETKRTVVTNALLQTIYPNIYAAGDVAGPYQFTHTAAHQAWYAAVNALFGDLRSFKVDYRVIPWATFVDPEVARVGLNEQDAKEQKRPYELTVFPMHELDRAIADGATKGFVKVLTVPGKDKILGVTIVGDHAGDLLAEYVLAMKHGLGLNKILGTIHSYPTLAEANKYAAGEWKRAHAPQKILSLLERYHRWKRG